MAKAVLKAKTTLDNRGFKVGMAQNQQAVSRFANGQIKQIGGLIGAAFAVGAVVNFAREMFNTADALDNASRQMGIGVEELQTLRRETELTAGSAEKMDSTLRKLTKSMANAVAGESEQVEGFQDLGISMEEITSLRPDQLFEKIAKSVSGAKLASKEASGASKILGRNYVELNTVMKTIADVGIEGLKDQMLELNQIMTEDSVAAADAMEEAWNRTSRSWTTQAREMLIGVEDFRVAYRELAAGMKPLELAARLVLGPSSALGQIVGRAEANRTRAEMKTPGGAGAINQDAEASAVASPKTSAPRAADSIAKIGGILGGQTRSAKDQAMMASLRNQMAMVTSLDNIQKNTAPIREG